MRKPLDIKDSKYHLMYLPYNVEVMVPHLIWSGNPPEPSHNEMGPELLTYENLYDYKDWPIILRPISDLNKLIEVNGENFSPLDRLSSGFNNNYNYGLVEDLSKFIQDTKFSDIEKLKEWHFDFLGLIGGDIAVSIHDKI